MHNPRSILLNTLLLTGNNLPTPDNAMTNKKSTCPFTPREGYATAKVQRDYTKANPEIKDMVGDLSNEYTLMACNDPNAPLYFWQLYSILGEKPIIRIVTDFYNRVYQDKDDATFRHAFTRLASKEHHIATQAAYWIDAMGGGRVYHGGDYRLNFHHTHNAADVMNAAGAKRWMLHMRGALESARFDDPRVKPCILEFLKTKMMSYAADFGWDFDESDMELYQDDKA
jgi:truncated hemoglobin YjbI